MNIRQKIILSFAAFTITPCWIMSVVVQNSMIHNFEINEMRYMQGIVKAGTEAIDQYMAGRISEFEGFSGFITEKGGGFGEVSKNLEILTGLFPLHDFLVFMDKSRDELYYSKRTSKNQESENRVSSLNSNGDFIFDSLAKSPKEPIVSADCNNRFWMPLKLVAQAQDKSNFMVCIAAPVVNKEDKIVGALISRLNLNFAKNILEEVEDRSKGLFHAHAVDQKGEIYLSGNPDADYGDYHPDLEYKKFGDAVFGQQTGSLIYENSDGQKVITGFAKTRYFGSRTFKPLTVVSTADYSELIKPIEDVFDSLRLMFLVLIALVLSISILIANNFSRPIVSLMQAARKIGEGIHVPKISISSNDEIGELADSIAEMSQSISRRNIELVKSKIDAQRGERTKMEFLANMSHEIRTPMNGILGMLALLERTELVGKQSRYVKTIKSCGNGLMVILNDILDYSKGDAGKVALDHSSFDPKQCVVEVVALYKGKALEKKQSINFTCDPQLPEALFGDSTRIRQILTNLLSNATKFSGAGTIDTSVIVFHQDSKTCTLEFSVSDQGIGIEEKSRELLFRPFSQVENALSRKEGGTGLGLAISKKLVELMDGKIGVNSELGKGSTFYFRITLDKPTATDAAEEEDEYGIEMSATHPLEILVVDDNQINQKVTTSFLELLGYQADTANNASESFTKVDLKQYDLVFMDLRMPDCDGIEATEKILESHGKSAPFIVALTAQVFGTDREDCERAGMVGFLSKPLQRKKMAEVLLDISSRQRKKMDG